MVFGRNVSRNGEDTLIEASKSKREPESNMKQRCIKIKRYGFIEKEAR